jgi:hypothetical protein
METYVVYIIYYVHICIIYIYYIYIKWNTIQPLEGWNPVICENTNEGRGHCVKWNKPGTER